MANIDEILATDRRARAQLVASPTTLDGQPVIVRHSLLDNGQVSDLFDDDPRSLIRGMEANPLTLALEFSQPRTVTTLAMDFGSMEAFQLRVQLTRFDGTIETIEQEYKGLPRDPHVDLTLPAGPPVRQMRIEVTDMNQGATAHVHIRGLDLP